MDEHRVADYFVVAGLPECPLPLEEFSNEAIIKPTYKQDPITDINVINKSLGEKEPKGFVCIERTSSGCPADLNHGSIRCPEMFLCYRRSRDKPPLTDVGVLYDGKEKLMSGCEVVHTTPSGHPANVNNSNSSRIYITYRRASETASSDILAVVDICVVLTNKSESAPHAYCMINKNLNKAMVGSDVYVCYKKAMTKADVLAYKPAILGRYPQEDYENFPLPESVPLFCLPMGATIECWSAKAQHPLPVFSTFILTGSSGEKVYGAAVTFYEEFPEEKLTDLQLRHLGLKNKHIREQYRILKTVHSNKCICLLSQSPFFDAFKKFLSYLYRISITGPYSVPLERQISHFMFNVPYPSPQRPRILVQLNHEALSLSMPEDSPLPQSGASFITLLKNLGPDNCMSVLHSVLLEQKILIHSLRPAVLTGVAEAVSTIIFPFHWQCPYIPLCPLGLSGVLNAPCPFIVGIDSRYFDLYDPPPDVICVDLDTNTIWLSDDKKQTNTKILPKKPGRVLQDTLHKLFDQVCQQPSSIHTPDEVSLEMAPIDFDFKRKRKETLMELTIQEAFLRFMACLLKGYKIYLKPITKAPTEATTNAASLFDMQGFLKSRDKAYTKFFTQLMKTQTFIRFIEERSFVSDKDASLAFFDECTEKVDDSKDEPKLIEIDDSYKSERTVFIMPPEPTGLPEGVKYSYNGFPTLKPEFFLRKNLSTLSLPGKQSACPSSPMARRTKQEIRLSQKTAQQQVGTPMLWAKCLLGHCYSLWFIHLPAYVSSSQSKAQALRMGYNVLRRMKDADMGRPDEVCYRVVLQLCGQYNQPTLAVKVLFEMKQAGVQPNAITYGFYNKAVLESKWPSATSRGLVLWIKLRNVVMAVAQIRQRSRRRRTSFCSNSESDCLSRTSIDSCITDPVPDNASSTPKSDCARDLVDVGVNKNVNEERMSTGGASDKGYSSMTLEDARTLSGALVSSESQEQESNISGKTKKESRNPLRLSVRWKTRNKGSGDTSGASELRSPHSSDNNAPQIRNRLGSIVRRSASNLTSISSFETLKGSLVGNSAGLLMLSQSALDHHFAQQPGDLQSMRKRHKSAGDNHLKARSNSLFSSWKPRVISMENTLSVRYSDLVKKEFTDDVNNIDADVDVKQEKSELAVSGTDIKDSGLSLDENGISTSTFESPGSKDRVTSSPAKALPRKGTPVTENDPLGFFSTDPVLKSSIVSKNLSSNKFSCYSHSPASPYNMPVVSEVKDEKTQEQFYEEISTDAMCNTSLNRTPDTHTSLLHESGSRKLGELGRTSSSPDCLADSNKSKDDHLTSQKTTLSSTLSLDESGKPDKIPEMKLRRAHSLRRRNEMLSGVLKSAASMFANKISELKQSISIPSKSGSSSSLTRSDDRDSGTGDEENLEPLKTIKKKFSGSLDLVNKNDSDEHSVDGANDLSYEGVSVSPVPNQYSMMEFGDNSIEQEKLENIAIEVEMSSCCRCGHCHCLLFDEEIMAGWTAYDSNLNTSCCFCAKTIVPHLQIYVKDWREKLKNAMPCNTAQVGSHLNDGSEKNCPDSSVFSVKEQTDGNSGSAASHCTLKNFDSAVALARRRCTSECLTTATDCIESSVDSIDGCNLLPRSPLNLSIEEEPELPTEPSSVPEMKKDFMSRKSSHLEPITVPYLSPLVLRKELENVIENEGDLCMALATFVDEHPILFWNLVWYFKRIRLPSHLPGFLLTAETINISVLDPTHTEKHSSRNVLIRPLWDNIRIHEEIGLPMYMTWNVDPQSITVNALVTEMHPFSRPLMHQIMSRIQVNDMLTPIKQLANARRRRKTKKSRFRSMYREILFLTLTACGRENIDHDAFDREYKIAFNKLVPAEAKRLQIDDKPRMSSVQWCRRVFEKLEV